MAGKNPKRRRVLSRARGGLKQRVKKRAAAPTATSRALQRAIAEPRPGGEDVLASQRLLTAMSRVQSLYIDEAKPKAVFDIMLQELLDLTGSPYGFIGEVLRSATQEPYLRTHAITDIAWNEGTKALMAQGAPNLEFRNLKTLFGHVMTTGRPVLANDPAHDPRSGGLPPGHPPMHAFLGLPLSHGGVLTGMVGIANRPGGYDETLIAYLQPFLGTCAQLLEGYRNKCLRNEAEEALRQNEDRFRVAMQGANEGIWDWDLRTNDVYFSERWKSMIGYADHEILDSYSEWESRLHPEDRERVSSTLTNYLENRVPSYDVEFRLQQKDGNYCWIHARGKAIRDAGGRAYRMVGSHTDITERKREEALQAAEKQALELVAKGNTLNDVLAFLCRAVESHTAPMLCAVMLADKEGTHLLSAAAPSLPDEYNQAVNGIPIGPTIGSCGNAAYFARPAIVADISIDPLWKDYAPLALAHGLMACWSHPILSSNGTMLGTFAVYYRQLREPQPNDLKVMERASYIAALAIEHAKMTKALQESEARFQAFMRHKPAVTFIKDEAGRHVYVNPKFEDLFGVSRDEVKNKTVFDFMPEYVATRLHRNDQLVFSSGQTLETEEAVPTPDGTTKHWLVIKFPLDTEQGRLLGGVAIDITERKKLERASQDQRDRLRLAMDMAGLAIWDWNILTNQVIWSDNCEQVKRLPDGSFGGTFEAYQRLVHPEDLPRLQADIECALSGQKAYHTEHRIVPPTGEVQWLEGNGVVYRDELGRPIRMVGTVRNITEQKRSEQTWRVNEERYARATAVGQVGVWELDVRAGTYYGDKNLRALFGYQADELSADPYAWLNLVYPDDQSIAMAHWQRIVRGEADDCQYELRMVRKDGTVIWTNVRGHAVRDLAGQVTHLIGATVDITHRKQMEDVLQKSHVELEQRVLERTSDLAAANMALQSEIAERKRIEDRLQTTQYAVDHAADQIFVIGPDGYFLDVNESACRRLSYNKEELLTMSVMDIDPNFPVGVWDKVWAELVNSKRIRLETRHRSRSGEIYPVELVANYLWHNGRELNYAIVRDITERKRAEEAVRESELQYKLLTEATFDGIAIHDKGILLEVNAGVERMFGYGPGELIGRSLFDLVADESRDQVARNMKEAVSGPYEFVGRRKDGTTIHGEVVARPYRYCGKDVRLIAGRDITERKRLESQMARYAEGLERQVAERTAEIAKLEAQRAQAEKVAALGQLAAGVAHEINNPIAGIQMAFTLVKQAVDPAHPHFEFVEMIDREITRVDTIVKNMYQLYRKEPRKAEAVDLQSLIRSLEGLFAKRMSQQGITFVADVPPSMSRLYVPQSDLLQVLMNLLQNAIDSSGRGGTIRLLARQEDGLVKIMVSDEGAGIEPDVLPHIFDPFFTTKTERDQKRMGLGLSVSQSLVMAMGGKIEVHTELHHGSTFMVLFSQPVVIAGSTAEKNSPKEVVSHDE